VPDCTCPESLIVFFVPCLSDSYLINEFRPFNGKFCDIFGYCSHNLSDISQFKKAIGLSRLIQLNYILYHFKT
jgi:hypothetical protein